MNMSSAASRRRSRCISGWWKTQNSVAASTTFTGSNASWNSAIGRPQLHERLPRVILSPELLLHAYAAGIFPMAESAEDPELFWVDPTRRGIIPLDGFHVPRRLRRVIRQGQFS